MRERYRIAARSSTPGNRELADWLAKDGQLLIPLVELLEKGERAIDEVIDVMGRATVEAVLRMSAERVAGPKEQGRPRRGPGGVLARGAGLTGGHDRAQSTLGTHRRVVPLLAGSQRSIHACHRTPTATAVPIMAPCAGRFSRVDDWRGGCRCRG